MGKIPILRYSALLSWCPFARFAPAALSSKLPASLNVLLNFVHLGLQQKGYRKIKFQ